MNLKNTPILTIVGVAAAVVAAGAFFGPGIIDSIKNPTAKVEMKRTVAGNIDSGRFTVTLGAKFKDSLAYDGERGIYMITDNKTGKEFVGVSGVGIAELGSHSETHTDGNGKSQTTIVTDER